MSLYTSDALILRTYKLGEADRIVVFLTSDRGKDGELLRERDERVHDFLVALKCLLKPECRM